MAYVYLLRMRETDYFKVGISQDVEARIAALRTGTPFPIDLVAAYEQRRAMDVERAIHTALQKYRVQGEWFMCELDEIKRTFTAFNAMAHIDDLIDISEPGPEPEVTHTLAPSLDDAIDGLLENDGDQGVPTIAVLSVLRSAGITRDKAREILRLHGLAMPNSKWQQAARLLERDDKARALFTEGRSFRAVAAQLRAQGFSVDNQRLVQLRREASLPESVAK